MFDFALWLQALGALAAFAFAGWLVSLPLRNVSIVDSLWSLMFLLAAVVYFFGIEAPGPRATLVLALVAVWALRLAIYITWRNRGHGEDRRYQAIRANNDPGFAWKSVYIVFGLQALLAWVISLPLLAAIGSGTSLNALDAIGCALFVVGFVFEAGGDWQLARFKADPANRGQVMDRGLWRYTRHPNYFGDFCIWWSFFCFALAAGGWWSFVGPVLMTLLLLKVSGVALLEKDIAERRPAYADYLRRTNAFFPGPRKAASQTVTSTALAVMALSVLDPHAADARALTASGRHSAAPMRALNFDVYLDERRIGHHRFELRGDDEDFEVKTRAKFAVRILRITAFSYAHENSERWRDGCLADIRTRTDSNGRLQQVSGTTEGEQFVVATPEGRRSFRDCVGTFAYWDRRLLERERLLNPQTGEYLPVQFVPGERGAVRIGTRTVPVDRWQLTAPGMDITVTYAAGSGEWVALDSRVDGGKMLRYRRDPRELSVVAAPAARERS